MPLYHAIVLAIVQGLTEFLPISSTAHLALFPWLLHWNDPGLTFDVALHVGTLIAVTIYFWRLWLELLKGALALGNPEDPAVRRNRELFWFLFIGTLPAGFAGWFLEHAAEHELREPIIIGAALILVGILMWLGERVSARRRSLGEISLADSVLVGAAQALAVIPGVSRSGVTMTAGLLRGMDRETSARFSFLLSTPVIAGAALKKAVEIHREGLPSGMLLPFMVGTLVAALVGYAVIAGLMRYLERGTFKIFIVYRMALGVIVLVLGWGLRHA